MIIYLLQLPIFFFTEAFLLINILLSRNHGSPPEIGLPAFVCRGTRSHFPVRFFNCIFVSGGCKIFSFNLPVYES